MKGGGLPRRGCAARGTCFLLTFGLRLPARGPCTVTPSPPPLGLLPAHLPVSQGGMVPSPAGPQSRPRQRSHGPAHLLTGGWGRAGTGFRSEGCLELCLPSWLEGIGIKSQQLHWES